MTTPVHDNSLKAFTEEYEKLSRREQDIYCWLQNQQRAVTDREIKDGLFGEGADMNTCRPRITTLIDKGWVKEVGKTTDAVTCKTVRLVRSVSSRERLRNLPHVQGELL